MAAAVIEAGVLTLCPCPKRDSHSPWGPGRSAAFGSSQCFLFGEDRSQICGFARQTNSSKHKVAGHAHSRWQLPEDLAQPESSAAGSSSRLPDSASKAGHLFSAGSRNRASVATHYAMDDDIAGCSQESNSSSILVDGREPDTGPVEDLQVGRTFIMDGGGGRLVCNSKGCRPLLPPAISPDNFKDAPAASSSTPLYNKSVQELDSRTAAYRATVSRREADRHSQALPQFPMEFAQFLDQMWLEREAAEKYFEAAVQLSPYDSKLLTLYAEFSWKQLKDVDRAEVLYGRALLESPDSAEVLASYALFLWQGE